MWVKINALVRERKEDLLVFAIIVLVALLSFGLGRLSVVYTIPASSDFDGVGVAGKVQIMYPEGYAPNQSSAAVYQAVSPNGRLTKSAIEDGGGSGVYIASKNGTAYYLESCSGALRIKPENRVRFKSKESAEAAGYHAAANCPGL